MQSYLESARNCGVSTIYANKKKFVAHHGNYCVFTINKIISSIISIIIVFIINISINFCSQDSHSFIRDL